MNERPLSRIGQAALNVGLWVYAVATRVDERTSAHGRSLSTPECLRVGLSRRYGLLTDIRYGRWTLAPEGLLTATLGHLALRRGAYPVLTSARCPYPAPLANSRCELSRSDT